MTHPLMALAGEPEAVSEDEQRELTKRARLGPLEVALDEAKRDAGYHLAQARHAERRVRRLEQRLSKARLAV